MDSITTPGIDEVTALSDTATTTQPLAEDRKKTEKRDILVVVNPYATTVSARLKELVLYALKSKYTVQAVETERQNHATDLAREAVGEGFDLVVAFGGDGTVNEVANGLAGSDLPMTVLPGGSTNVFARTLGIPNDIVEATDRLIELSSNFAPRPADLGMVNDRYFVFGSGVGIDGDAIRRVDSHPQLKWRFGDSYYIYALMRSFYKVKASAPFFDISVDGEEPQVAVSAVLQNTAPYTYLRAKELHVCDDIHLDSGTLSVTALKRAKQRDLPSIAARLLSNTATKHRQVFHAEGVKQVTVKSACFDREGSLRTLPVHVDGDFIGEFEELTYKSCPHAIRVLS